MIGRANLGSREVIGALRDFLRGQGGEWDWDDFTSISIKDARLEAIRLRALAIDLPLTDAGHAELIKLLAEAERL